MFTYAVGVSGRPNHRRPVSATWITEDGVPGITNHDEWATAADDPTVPDDNDYEAASGTLQWTSDDYADRNITVIANGDVLREQHEWFSVVVTTPDGEQLRRYGQINNDDAELMSC